MGATFPILEKRRQRSKTFKGSFELPYQFKTAIELKHKLIYLDKTQHSKILKRRFI